MSDENINPTEEKIIEQSAAEALSVSEAVPNIIQADFPAKEANQLVMEVNNSENKAENNPIIQEVEKPPLVENTTVEPQIKPENEVLKPVETTNLVNSSSSVSSIPVSVIDPVASVFKANMVRARELLVKARFAVQTKKKQKLEKIMNLFTKKEKIKNHDVRDLLHIADETATGYLNILKKEGKIKQNGQGGSIYYTKVILD
ncbi:MAG: hypothetical protein NT068_03955 [Candidatus Nomurabacteria bacterium]|nr:hypothetical protein [Candidatus Nomurabacteria bacterium]